MNRLISTLAVAVLGLFALPLRSVAADTSGPAAAPTSVARWDVFELTLKGPSDGNPFVEVRVSAVFTNGARTIEVPGFYDGDGVYRVRFMPEQVGTWHYETKSNRWPLTGTTGSFTVTPAGKGNHGPVRVFNTFHFAYADGTPFKQIGTTIYNWLDTPEEVQEQTLQTLAQAPFNKARMLITPQPTPYQQRFAPPRWPFVGKPPHDWDYTRFNPEYFRHYEKRLLQLRDLGVEADVILLNPYGKWGFETMDAADDERYVRYVVARFAAFRNIWWSMANEYDFLRTKTEADWDRLFQVVQQADPFNHLRSIHNGSLIYDHNKPWVTHVSMQNGSAVEEPGRAEMYRGVYRKPIVYDEVKYEGNSHYRWGNLSGQEMVHRFWCGTVAGTYVGHGDYFATVVEDTWTSFGGKLTGVSAPRLAFLRKILEEGPAEGIDPIDKWQDPRTAGIPGSYYLTYFGHETPKEWAFRLYKNGVTDGMRFKADVIDTWAMTVTPIEGEFVTKRQGNYDFVDAQGRVIPLPGKPGIAIRLQRVGADGPAKTELPTD
ncbi:DUF5060 domain-containing protein [Opitutus sp. ER46]|uniref:DUF5060 domain-containing protein n=1 Tax=Opitutus sp. ER46 TaxID=2161864 RepID=UPI000D2FFE47|nr:DUF5060 domain-containing protein [Opitutus sp. ER46]PTX94385.1 DUF5060 domain-containing protein [Opitutus sp. ER46]